MESLKVGYLEEMVNHLKKVHGKGYKDIRVFIGDDDELNGVHHAWQVLFFKKDQRNYSGAKVEEEEEKYLIEIVEEGTNDLGDDEVFLLIN